tara:strand:+ start:396 stop:545 length:150 start_codon:yes stop_codon:yes gene_type:complete
MRSTITASKQKEREEILILNQKKKLTGQEKGHAQRGRIGVRENRREGEW